MAELGLVSCPESVSLMSTPELQLDSNFSSIKHLHRHSNHWPVLGAMHHVYKQAAADNCSGSKELEGLQCSCQNISSATEPRRKSTGSTSASAVRGSGHVPASQSMSKQQL